MLAKRIIPCLDVKGGRVVKGVGFVDLKDAGDPVEIARIYEAQGADELCFLDITASSDEREILLDIVRRTADEVSMPVTVGGGVRSVHDVQLLLSAGADKVAINTAAVKCPEFVRKASRKFGSSTIVVAIDAKRSSASPLSWEVYTHGGRNPTGIDVSAWAEQMEKNGAGELLLTSMDQDGKTTGYDLDLTRTVCERVHVPVIASGGVGTLAHLFEGISIGKAGAVLAASIFHFQTFSINEAKTYLAKRGIPVRL